MGTKNHEQEEAIRQSVRDVLAVNPFASARTLARIVSEKTNLPVTKEYILKLKKKVSRQSVVEIDRAEVIKEIAAISERHRMMINQLQKIIFAEEGKHKTSDIISAVRQVFNMERDLFYLMMDAGIFAKKPKKEDSKLPEKLSPEVQLILDNAKYWAFRPPDPEDGPVMMDAGEYVPEE